MIDRFDRLRAAGLIVIFAAMVVAGSFPSRGFAADTLRAETTSRQTGHCAAPCACGICAADPCLPRPQDEIWLVRTDDPGCGCSTCCDGGDLRVYRFDGQCHWLTSDVPTLLAGGDPAAMTTVWVHGNRVDEPLSRQRGRLVYSRLIAQTEDPRPVRFVIFSWPAEQPVAADASS